MFDESRGRRSGEIGAHLLSVLLLDLCPLLCLELFADLLAILLLRLLFRAEPRLLLRADLPFALFRKLRHMTLHVVFG